MFQLLPFDVCQSLQKTWDECSEGVSCLHWGDTSQFSNITFRLAIWLLLSFLINSPIMLLWMAHCLWGGGSQMDSVWGSITATHSRPVEAYLWEHLSIIPNMHEPSVWWWVWGQTAFSLTSVTAAFPAACKEHLQALVTSGHAARLSYNGKE